MRAALLWPSPRRTPATSLCYHHSRRDRHASTATAARVYVYDIPQLYDYEIPWPELHKLNVTQIFARPAMTAYWMSSTRINIHWP